MHALAEESKNHIKDIHEKYMSRADEIRKELTEKHREEVSQFYSYQICWEKMPQGAEKKCCWNDSTNFGLILICFNLILYLYIILRLLGFVQFLCLGHLTLLVVKNRIFSEIKVNIIAAVDLATLEARPSTANDID